MLQSSRVSARLLVMMALMVVGMSILTAISLSNERASLLEDRQVKTRDLVDSVGGIAAHYFAQQQAGTLSEPEAKRAALNAIRALRYGNNDYFWINDYTPKVIMHPIKPELEGQDVSDLRDSSGNRLFVEFVDIVKKEGSGFVSYLWPKPGFDSPVAKISYVKGFQPWGWVIGTGIYIDDVSTIFWNRVVWLVGVDVAGVLVIGLAMLLIGRSITQPLSQAASLSRAVADGRLDNPVKVIGGGETGALLGSLNAMQHKLSGILREVGDCARNMGQSAFQVAAISTEIAEVSRQQESRSQEVTQAMQQLRQISYDVQTQAAEAAGRSDQVESLARGGLDSVHRNIDSMDETTRQVGLASHEIQELEEAAQQIHTIVNAIKDIAAQTNLLALNAAIEAARAGEDGRGFAVVADEVRKLAERTTKSAAEVGSIISQLSGRVQQAALTMDVVVEKVSTTQEEARKTAHVIDQMAKNAIDNARVNQEITGSSQQQVEQFKLLEATMETLFAILKESGSKVETTAAIGEDLRVMTSRLNDIMSGFSFAGGISIEAQQDERRRAPRAHNSLRVKITQGQEVFEAVCSDFSLTGLRLRLARPLAERESIRLGIYLPADELDHYKNQRPIEVQGRLAWQRNEASSFLSGIEFSNLDNAQREGLRRCFAFFQKNPEF